jgi:hypothetical protein
MTFTFMFILHSTDTTTLMWKKIIQKHRIKAFLTLRFSSLIIDDRTESAHQRNKLYIQYWTAHKMLIILHIALWMSLFWQKEKTIFKRRRFWREDNFEEKTIFRVIFYTPKSVGSKQRAKEVECLKRSKKMSKTISFVLHWKFKLMKIRSTTKRNHLFSKSVELQYRIELLQ